MTYLLYYNNEKTIRSCLFQDVMNDLYYLRATIPNKKNIMDYIKTGSDNKIKKYFKSKEIDVIINEIKTDISKIDNYVPLYDEYTKNMYLMSKELVYDKVVYEYYRFPDDQLLEILNDRYNELKQLIATNNAIDKSDVNLLYKQMSMKREFHKLELMLNFLKNFDNEILHSTYIKVFYFYANSVGKNLTVCLRPSFLSTFKHIKPYYTRSELINLALNMGLIKPDNKYYDREEVMKLCDIVKENDISSEIILNHQNYISDNNKIGIIQYYSLQGSYFINQYLRNLANYPYKNELLESQIKSMWELVYNAPEFDKSYTLYRFIHNDSYLKSLKIGDLYTENSFISTTRDPFYRSEIYKFGFILIKIKIPGNVKGVGLCIESYSHFPEEQEIILCPKSILRLDFKDENALYYHTDNIYASKINTRYEFTYMGKEDNISIYDRIPLPIRQPEQLIDFLNLPVNNSITVQEKIHVFINNWVNEINQFKTKIGNKEYTIICEWYDSTTAYKNFYSVTTKNGFSLYTIEDNYIQFFIELGQENDLTYMYVNYYFRYSASNKQNSLNDNDFILFLSKMAYYFGIRNVVIYSEYASCDYIDNKSINMDDKKVYRGGNYCVDIYKYLKLSEKRFQNKNVSIDSTDLKPRFSYYELDRLRSIDPLVKQVIKNDDRDEIYQIYTKTYQSYVDKKKHNMADFYNWLIENHCVNLNSIVDKMKRIYNVNNPFTNDYYVLDAMSYLYNKSLIYSYGSLLPSHQDKKVTQDEQEPKNKYRLNYYQKNIINT